MAKAVLLPLSKVLLGFPDEEICGKQVDYTTSKIGGHPNWTSSGPPPGTNRCPLCSHNSVALVAQIYAPLEGSAYHRTLYVLACLQPQCWNQRESWKCFRGQVREVIKAESRPKVQLYANDWVDGADDWGGSDEDDDEVMTDEEEEDNNGNVNLNKKTGVELLERLTLDPKTDQEQQPHSVHSRSSSSFSEDLSPGDANANQPGFGTSSPTSSGAIGGAVEYTELNATAEIEEGGDQDLGEIVAVETPDADLIANNTCIPELFALAQHVHNKTTTTTTSASSPLASRGHVIKPLYLAVEEEVTSSSHATQNLTEHERQLLLEYKVKETEEQARKRPAEASKAVMVDGGADGYEKVKPKHGDVAFHKYLSVINKNPGQVLRYSRDVHHTPLFLSGKPALSELPRTCLHCNGPVVCEVQLLPTLIPSLKLNGEEEGAAGLMASAPSVLEFGNVLIYTCLKSCWMQEQTTNQKHHDYRQEQVFVQAEAL